jgi:UDP-glucose 4-epimerase
MQYMDKMTTSNYDVFNFGSGNGFSVLQVIKMFEEILQQKISYRVGERRPGDLERLVTASMKAETLLDWKPEKSLQDMCESCVKFTILLLEITRKEKMKA